MLKQVLLDLPNYITIMLHCYRSVHTKHKLGCVNNLPYFFFFFFALAFKEAI